VKLLLDFRRYCSRNFELLQFKMDQMIEGIKILTNDLSRAADAVPVDNVLTRNFPLDTIEKLDMMEDTLATENIHGEIWIATVSINNFNVRGNIFNEFKCIYVPITITG